MFNSRDPIYRNPTGAVRDGQSIHFKITLPRDYHCNAAYLLVDKENGPTHCLDMFWCGMNGDFQEWWECDFIPDEVGLYFYHFEFKTDHGRRRLSRGYGGEAVPQGFDKWQLTVYSKDYTVPKWLTGGIMYEIFPDRFYRSEDGSKALPERLNYRRMHKIWDEEPDWRPNIHGVIENDDFFGGNLKGIEEKLPYIASLGVNCIYLTPIFEAHSNHRYDTADYSNIDPLLGSEEDFKSLCKAAARFDIHILIDGVFNHTGSDSIYFNKQNRYDSIGAYNSQSSPYISWYSFHNWPEGYDSWWNFDTMPNLNEADPEFQNYMVGEKGIVKKWIDAGASGWRLDVADELPDDFLDKINMSAKEQDSNALILGEVWEDASSKTAYGVRRRYLLGGQLDSVMNYPFSDAIFSYLLWGDSAFFFEEIESILENYPPHCINLLMNHIGTHDTIRAITLLAGQSVGQNGREWQSAHHLSAAERDIGLSKMRLASLIQFTLPGVPSIYYGDEVGVEGYKDPFNRGTYPWDSGDNDLMLWYRSLGRFRNSHSVFAEGKFRKILQNGDVIAYERYNAVRGGEEVILVITNRDAKICIVDSDIIPSSAISVLGSDVRSEQHELEPYGYAVYSYFKYDKSETESALPETDEDGTKIAHI